MGSQVISRVTVYESQACQAPLARKGCVFPGANLTNSYSLLDNTLDNRDSYWSSIGTAQDVDEMLLYGLKFPLCRLTHVDIMVYRAHFQFG